MTHTLRHLAHGTSRTVEAGAYPYAELLPGEHWVLCCDDQATAQRARNAARMYGQRHGATMDVIVYPPVPDEGEYRHAVPGWTVSVFRER